MVHILLNLVLQEIKTFEWSIIINLRGEGQTQYNVNVGAG